MENSSIFGPTSVQRESQTAEKTEAENHLSIFRPVLQGPIPTTAEPEASFSRRTRPDELPWKTFPEETAYPEEEYDDFKFRFNMSLCQRAKLSFGEIYKCADDLRQAGNRKFRYEKYFEAVERYEKANNLLDEAIIVNKKEETKARAELQFKLFTNIAICQLRLDDPSQAVAACKAALAPGMPDPKNGKVYYRYATASLQLRKYDDATKYIELALMFDPSDFNMLNFQKKILIEKEEEQYALSKLYKKMARG